MKLIIIKLIWGMVSKVLTERFVSEALVYSLNSIAMSTDNNLDDRIVESVARALSVDLHNVAVG
jgi:hypothetical protein